MLNSPILEAQTADWTYEDVTEELEHLAIVEELGLELEPANEPVPPDLPPVVGDDEIGRASEELRTVAELEGR